MNTVADNFSRILNKVVYNAYRSKTPVAKNKGEIVLSDLVVVRNEKYYDIIHKDTAEVLYTDIALIEAALLIAKYHQLKSYTRLREVLSLEKAYNKHHTDMQFSTRSHASARESGDTDAMNITATRYENAKVYATQAKQRIRRICDGMR